MRENSNKSPGRPAPKSGKVKVYFASVKVAKPQGEATLPAKLSRVLSKFDLKGLCKNDRVPIKMHLGGDMGYTTLHPLLVRTVVNAVKEAGGSPFVVEGCYEPLLSAAKRGYTAEVLGCPVLSAGGPYDSHLVRRPLGYRSLDEIKIFGAIWDAPCLINLSHVKGHGACAYGGACKNISMGCVSQATRGKIHSLEGGIGWEKDRCTFCGRCVKACDQKAISLDAKKRSFNIFFHDCRYCRHCISACPAKALRVTEKEGYRHFQEGMALSTREVMNSFDPARVLHVNVLTDITMFCDCWGITTPSVVPDIGILASQDMVAVELASLKKIRVKDFIPGSLIGNRKLGPGKHLFEKIHGKDPFVQLRALERLGVGSGNFEEVEVQ